MDWPRRTRSRTAVELISTFGTVMNPIPGGNARPKATMRASRLNSGASCQRGTPIAASLPTSSTKLMSGSRTRRARSVSTV